MVKIDRWKNIFYFLFLWKKFKYLMTDKKVIKSICSLFHNYIIDVRAYSYFHINNTKEIQSK